MYPELLQPRILIFVDRLTDRELESGDPVLDAAVNESSEQNGRSSSKISRPRKAFFGLTPWVQFSVYFMPSLRCFLLLFLLPPSAVLFCLRVALSVQHSSAPLQQVYGILMSFVSCLIITSY